MCLAVPGKILSINGKKATISVLGAESEISIELVQDVRAGDYVIVHAGCAISKIDEDEALKTIELFRELEELSHE